MALLNFASGHVLTRRLAAVPPEFRMTVLTAVNAPMAAEVEHLDSNAATALSRLRKLDVDSAVEAVSYLSSAATLHALQADTRVQVSDAVRTRARDLEVNLSEPLAIERKSSAPTTTDRTSRAVAKPFDEALNALSKMATIDYGVVRTWADTLGPATPWDAVITAVQRHYGLVSALLNDALEREALNIDALWNDHQSKLIDLAQSYSGQLNATVVSLLERAIDEGYCFNSLPYTGCPDDVEALLVNAALPLRQLCGVAGVDEVVAGLTTMLAAYVPTGSRYDSVGQMVTSVFVNTRTAEMADALAPLVQVAKSTLGDAAWRLGQAAAGHLITIEGISNTTTRTLWRDLAEASTVEIFAGKLGPQPTDEDITWLLERYADPTDEGFDLQGMIYRLGWGEPNPALAGYMDRILMEVPGSAEVLLSSSRSWGTNWMIEAVMAKASELLGSNVPAWNIFMQQVDGHSGLFGDLVSAAIIATATN